MPGRVSGRTASPIFETERLKLRPMTKDDYHLMRLLDTNTQVVRYLGHGHVRNEDETKRNLNKILNDYDKYGLSVYIAEDKNTKEFLGRTGLIPWILEDEFHWEVGYSFKPTAWGKGYATEAAKFLVEYGFKNLKADYLISLIHPDNKGSINVAKKAGMTYWKDISISSIYASSQPIIAATYRIDP